MIELTVEKPENIEYQEEFKYDKELEKDNNISSVNQSGEEINSFEDELNEIGNVQLTQEKFVLILNRITESLLAICGFLLSSFLIGDRYRYNPFPWDVNEASNILYQCGQLLFLLSYWSTNILLLRIMTIIAYAFFIMWAISTGDKPSMDFYLYTIIFVILNIRKIVELLYKKRKIVFDDLREQIYVNTFKGFMTRNEFKDLVNISLMREITKNAFYSKVNDKCNNLSILIKGKLRVYKTDENSKMTYINENEFIDSAEWLLRYQNHRLMNQKKDNKENKEEKKIKKNLGKRFNHYIKAEYNCIYLTWPIEILKEFLKDNMEMEQKITGVLGVDVSTKLFGNSAL